MFSRKLIVLAGVLAVFLPVLAFAGAIDLPQTGQTKCYNTAGTEIDCTDTGQDGQIRAGVPWPNPRFEIIYCDATGPCADQSSDCDANSSTDVVIDKLTGLMWARNGNLKGTREDWDAALEYVNNLTLGGYSDWRLPNVNEIEILVNLGESSPATWLNNNGFINVQSGFYSYLSSTICSFNINYVWHVYMTNGGVLSHPKSGGFGYGYVWPVRSGPSGTVQLPQTGQKISYNTGDDGDLEMGVTWPDPRFTDNNNNTVTDNLTGLMWLKDANCIKTNYPDFDNDYNAGDGAVTWQNALDFIKGINNGTYINCGAGYSDWRFPNRKELRSLIDYSRYGPALPSGHPFINVQSGYYWPSTTYAYLPYAAWIVDVWNGYGSQFFKNDDYYVWPVRLGQVATPTAIELASFKAKANDNGSVTLTWQTATEINNAGFNIYRSRSKDGNYKKINAELIDPKGSETEGASYSFKDTPPSAGTYYYKLEDVEYGGKTTMHGPVKVRVR